MIKAVIFNFDGTIIDTETPRYETFREVYEQHDLALELGMYAPCIGTGLQFFNPYEYLIGRIKLPVNLDSVRSSIRGRHSLLMEEEGLRPGVLDYLKHAKGHGLQLGLVSSSSRKWVDGYLHRLGIDRYFDYVRTSDDVARITPHPELYQQMLACMRLAPHQAVAIEDSPHGLRAAAAAGLYSVIVPNPVTSRLEFDRANYRVGSLKDLELGQLLANPQGRVAGPREHVVSWSRVIQDDNEAEVC
ncbi:MAG: phosphoglycolate phosphatase [Paenibacillaceae bacterium]|nr:phosphoglycolate phosphatase [Paenibacillaceae bacterium]